MKTLYNGFTLQLSAGSFPLSTDSMVLAHFAACKPNARFLDLGSGCGTLGLMLCAKNDTCQVTGIEIDPDAHRQALCNAENNSIAHRLTSICGDLRQLDRSITPGSVHCCVSNPPYFSGGPASKTVPTARRNDLCSTEELFCAASKALRYGGDFFLVHRPEMLAQLCACGSRHQLEAKRLRLVRHKEGGPVALILLQFRKGGKPGLIWEERTLHDSQGDPTPYYNQLYHLEA